MTRGISSKNLLRRLSTLFKCHASLYAGKRYYCFMATSSPTHFLSLMDRWSDRGLVGVSSP